MDTGVAVTPSLQRGDSEGGGSVARPGETEQSSALRGGRDAAPESEDGEVTA